VALQTRFRQGLALHRHGDLAAADRVYLEVLDQEPQHFDAMHMLGVVALQTRRTERGVELIREAIGLNEKVAAAHNRALSDLKLSADALASFDRAIALDPQFAEAHTNRGDALVNLRRAEEALASYQRAIAVKPDFADSYRNRCNVFSGLMRYAQIEHQSEGFVV
jgi:protein O-GlcNAc transferase